MKLKVGDILVCKQSLENWFTVGQKYKVLRIVSGYVDMGCNQDDYADFSLNSNDVYRYIWLFFMTEKELRKQKLEELESR